MESIKFGFGLFVASALLSRYSLICKSDDEISICEIWIYPIKSCKGIQVKSAITTKTGFENDRLFMLVDENGKFLSQRSQPKMSTIATSLNNGMESMTIPLKQFEVSEEREVQVWGEKCKANVVLCSDKNSWFDKYLGTKGTTLVKMKEGFKRSTDSAYAPNGQTSFSDGYPFLTASNASLSFINSKLDDRIPMERFRPNIIVDGKTPFGEDEWSMLHVPEAQASFAVVKPCSRCKIPTIDIDTSEFHPNNEPIRSMKAFRSGEAIGLSNPKWRKEVFFGQNLDHEGKEGVLLAVGMKMKATKGNKFLA